MSRPSSPSLWALGLILLASFAAIAANRLPLRPLVRSEATLSNTDNTQDNAVPDEAFEGARGWINSKPIRPSDLRGKIVLLDFWTYCCINCHHVLPDLAKLEEKYKNQLVVIGVHTAKFDAERDTENIRKKVNEYRIKHPVINDADQIIWNNFGVNGWPTLALIDATGNFVGKQSGEGNYDLFDRVIGELIAKHKARGELNEKPFVYAAESEKPHDQPLYFPGKLLADAAGNRLFITDTAHNRIVVTDLKGKFLDAIGSSVEGKADGPFDKARFNRPQGLCLFEDRLYVADTENHAIREVDLASKQVRTVAGTGQQSQRRTGSGRATSTGLNSPWDVLPLPGTRTLAIAMAGPHQIWKLNLATGTVGVWAGTGQEDIQDGRVERAAFAQPSGLATDGTFLFVADSEGSAVRAIRLTDDNGGTVDTLVGTHDLPFGRSLFEFGDVDGQGTKSRLQHCLGVAFAAGKLYVADTYNNKVKVIDPKTKTIRTLAGTSKPGASDDPPQFDHPGGLSVAGSTLFVADTNNHAIRTVDLKTNKVTTLALDGLSRPAPPRQPPTFPNAKVVNLAESKVAPGGEFTIAVDLTLPTGFKLNTDTPTPVRYLLEAPGTAGVLSESVSPTGETLDTATTTFEVAVPLAKPAEAGQTLTLKLSVSAYICKTGNNAYCTFQNMVWNVPVRFAEGGAEKVVLTNAAP